MFSSPISAAAYSQCPLKGTPTCSSLTDRYDHKILELIFISSKVIQKVKLRPKVVFGGFPFSVNMEPLTSETRMTFPIEPNAN